MPDHDPTDLLAKVLTVSDGVVAGTREDRGGAGLVDRLRAEGYQVIETRVVADGRESVGEALVEMTEGFSGVVVTTGGTGFGPRPPGVARISATSRRPPAAGARAAARRARPRGTRPPPWASPGC